MLALLLGALLGTTLQVSSIVQIFQSHVPFILASSKIDGAWHGPRMKADLNFTDMKITSTKCVGCAKVFNPNHNFKDFP